MPMEVLEVAIVDRRSKVDSVRRFLSLLHSKVLFFFSRFCFLFKASSFLTLFAFYFLFLGDSDG
jgi:hypothetical protein